MRRNDISKVTRFILQAEPYSRQNDGYLIRRVVEALEPNLYKKNFMEIMDNLQYYGISCESITRARRKYLEQHPELKIKQVEQARREKEQEYYEEYSRHIPKIDLGRL